MHDSRQLACAMPQPNYSIIFCLIFLGLAVLVRTVAIGQRAYDLLLPPTLADDPAPALDAVASGHTAEPLTKIDTGAVAVVNAPSFEDTRPDVAAENPPGEAPPAKPEIPPQIASERQNMAPTRAPRHRKGHSYRYYSSRFQPFWGPAVW